MRNRRYVRDAIDFEAIRIEGADSGFTSRTGPLDHDIHIFHTEFFDHGTRLFRRHLGCEGRALTRSAKARATGGRPSQRIALAIGDGDDCIVE